MLKGNKGEWSEIYVLLKLLAEGKLYAADSNLNSIPDIYYPLIKILREELNSKIDYLYESEIKIVDSESGDLIGSVPSYDFAKQSESLLWCIKEEKGSFSVPEVGGFLEEIGVGKLKAKSTDKRDITLIVHDRITGLRPELGFSIKSQLGSPATLLNSNKDATNFIYKVSPKMKINEIEKINQIDTSKKIRDRIDRIVEGEYTIKYHSIANEVFEMNLQLIDSYLPQIIGEIVLEFFNSKKRTMKEFVEHLSITNPCNFNMAYSHKFYEYKVKNFLTDIALGMTPSKVWEGHYDATGGYIIVKEDGELVCYHVYNRNEFQDYLIQNTVLDSPSSTRHDYGYLYEDNGEVYLKLNLQIRFKH